MALHSAPADADSVLTVGAVDSSGVIGYFSSNGPTADGRVKPNVVGQGVMTAYVNVNGNTSAGNGTSYSSPLMAGLTTCLWQANRNKNNMSIIREVEQSSNLFDAPNGEYGYGAPNFYNSMLALGVYPNNQNINNTRSFLYPNPFNTELNVYYYASGAGLVKLEFMDVSGRVLSSQQQEVYSKSGCLVLSRQPLFGQNTCKLSKHNPIPYPISYETKSGSPPHSKTIHLAQLDALAKYLTNYIGQQMYFVVLFFRRT